MKFGRVRLTITPGSFSSNFSRSLILNDGYIEISSQDNTTVMLWVDAFNPNIHVEVNSSTAMSLTAAFESWRDRDRLITETGELWEQGKY